MGSSGESFCESEQLIRKYLRFIIRVVAIISRIPAAEPIRMMAAYSPAEASMPKDIKKLWNAVISIFAEAMPSVKATARYPMAMGMPSLSPFKNIFLFKS